MKNHGMVCPPPQNQKRTKTLRDPTIITFPHFLRTLGVFRRQMCPVSSGRVDNCVRVGQTQTQTQTHLFKQDCRKSITELSYYVSELRSCEKREEEGGREETAGVGGGGGERAEGGWKVTMRVEL